MVDVARSAQDEIERHAVEYSPPAGHAATLAGAACSCIAGEGQYNRNRQSCGVSSVHAVPVNRRQCHARRPGVFPLLTEAEVQRSFRNLFKTKDVPLDTFEKAEALLDELRPESPLRHRLSLELEEIRKLHTAKA
jgi:hypothetical protein